MTIHDSPSKILGSLGSDKFISSNVVWMVLADIDTLLLKTEQEMKMIVHDSTKRQGLFDVWPVLNRFFMFVSGFPALSHLWSSIYQAL